VTSKQTVIGRTTRNAADSTRRIRVVRLMVQPAPTERENTMTNLFDFTDVSDLPEDLAKRMTSGGSVNPNVETYSAIVEAGAVAGVAALNISQIEAVATRMGIDPVASQQSIRNALNLAVKGNRLIKPSRQTYGVKVVDTADTADTTAVEVPTVAEPVTLQAVPAPIDDDPLA